MMDPKIAEMIGQSPQAQTLKGAIEAHIAEHMGFQYRQQIEEELGTQLPPPEEPLPPEVENKLSGLVADAANRLFYRHKEEMAREEAEKVQQDPIFQLELRKQTLAEEEFRFKRMVETRRLEQTDEKLESAETTASMRMGVDLATAENEHKIKTIDSVVKAGAQLVKANGNGRPGS